MKRRSLARFLQRKVATLQKLRSQTTKIMQENNNKKNLLVQNVLDASVNYQNNGDILIMPCLWEDEKQVTDGSRVRYRGGIEVDPDGRTTVKRYNEGGNGPRYNLLFKTPHGKVYTTKRWRKGYCPSRHKLIIRFEFYGSYPKKLIEKLFGEETKEVKGFINKSKEETIWK